MVELVASSPLDGHSLPLCLGSVTLAEARPGQITSVAPYNDRSEAASATLRAAGLGFPLQCQSFTNESSSILWAGRGTAFLIGAPPPPGLEDHAALTDQSDGWAALTLGGRSAEAVLARLVPLDLRLGACPVGSSQRSLLGHMPLLLWRMEAEVFLLLVFRSMAASAVHDLTGAMRSMAARAGI